MEYVDLTSSWESTMKILTLVLTDGTDAEAIKGAHKEIIRGGKILDEITKERDLLRLELEEVAIMWGTIAALTDALAETETQLEDAAEDLAEAHAEAVRAQFYADQTIEELKKSLKDCSEELSITQKDLQALEAQAGEDL